MAEIRFEIYKGAKIFLVQRTGAEKCTGTVRYRDPVRGDPVSLVLTGDWGNCFSNPDAVILAGRREIDRLVAEGVIPREHPLGGMHNMKTVGTGTLTRPVNLLEKNGYLVYGGEKPSDVVGMFEAWYWIDIPGNPPKRMVGPSRLEKLLFATAGEAIAIALQYGATIAGELPSLGGTD